MLPKVQDLEPLFVWYIIQNWKQFFLGFETIAVLFPTFQHCH